MNDNKNKNKKLLRDDNMDIVLGSLVNMIERVSNR